MLPLFSNTTTMKPIFKFNDKVKIKYRRLFGKVFSAIYFRNEFTGSYIVRVNGKMLQYNENKIKSI